ncbi:hypothetical protein BYT27DRAFT_7188607, partial [Phlegmacium glaucopus]
NIKQPEFHQDVQLEIMSALAFIRLNWKISPLPVRDPPTKTPERRLLAILNWIASFFVRDSTGDCVASALSVEDHKIKLYLAANRGQPQDEDIENGNKLISALCQAFHEPDPQTAQTLLFNLAISITYRRFFHKLDTIKDIRFPSCNDGPTPVVPSIKMFESLVTKWAEAGGVEQNQELLEFAPQLVTHELGEEGEGVSALKAVFKYFVESIDRGLKDCLENNRLLDVAWVSCQFAMRLLLSDFFSRVVISDVHDVKPFDAEEYSFLQKLKRRLWRIARYWIDAGSLATTGTTWIRRTLGNNELTEGSDCFKIVWVGLDAGTLPENHGVQYVFQECPQVHFRRLLGEFGFEKLSQNEQQSLTTDLEKLWPPTITPFLHCELQLVSYLQRHDIAAHMNLIGASKLMCWACNIYVREVNKCRKVSSKPYYMCFLGHLARQIMHG